MIAPQTKIRKPGADWISLGGHRGREIHREFIFARLSRQISAFSLNAVAIQLKSMTWFDVEQRRGSSAELCRIEIRAITDRSDPS